MFIRNDLPELGADLVAALATLNVDGLSHFWSVLDRPLYCEKEGGRKWVSR
jgi:hypothetical protein